MRRALTIALAATLLVSGATVAHASEGSLEASVYFMLDGSGTETTPGPHLVPVARSVDRNTPATEAMQALLAGPTAMELATFPGLSSAVPAGTELRWVAVTDGVATVDLTGTFVTGGGSLSFRSRLAQVVFTLTQFPTVDEVRFRIDGVATTVFGGEGVIIPAPVDRTEFTDVTPLILLDDPPMWGFGGNPITVEGVANVFEGTVLVTLVDDDGLILYDGFTTASCGMGCWGTFEVEIPYDVDHGQWGAVIVAWQSPIDGSLVDVREHPVWLDSAYEGDVALGLVDPDTGIWRLRHNGQADAFYYGNPGDTPFLGDWNCNDVDTPGLYRRSDGYVYLRNSNTQGVADLAYYFGNPDDIPIVGDFNGDGCDTVSLYRPAEQRFYIINRLGSGDGGLGAADAWFAFGNPGDVPIVGDFDGDGVDEVGLHRPTTGLVYYEDAIIENGAGGAADHEFVFGDPGDLFVAGDWNGDGSESPGVYRQTALSFFLRFTNTQGAADAVSTWGAFDWLPVAGFVG